MIGKPGFLNKGTPSRIKSIPWNAPPIDKSGFEGRTLTDYLLPGELEILVDLVRKNNVRRMVEIGCQNGRTAKIILQNIPEIEWYMGLDVTRDHANTLAYQKNETPERPGEFAFSDPRFYLMLSRDGTAGPVPPFFADCIFIDGDHSFEGVKRDFELALNFIPHAANPLVIFHDYNDDRRIGVKRFLESECTELDLTHIEKTWLVFLK